MQVMAIGIVIQARVGSKRLPKKMLIPFYKEKGILEVILERLIGSNLQVPVIVATTRKNIDNEIEKIANKLGIDVFRGDEDDVLKRFIGVAEKYSFNKIIRLCADNPFIDIEALKFQVESFGKSDNIDYWCYSKSDKTPTIKTHYGFWAEGIGYKCLKQVGALTDKNEFHEHVTSFIYTHPTSFNVHYEIIDNFISDNQRIRLTVDTINDFNLSKEIYYKLLQCNIPFRAEKIVSFVDSNKEWLKTMQEEIISNTK